MGVPSAVAMKKLPKEGPVSIEVFSGWKDIATYLGKGVRTIQRYERTMGLPVRRPAGKLTGAVLATKAELDAWLAASPLRGAFQTAQRMTTFEPIKKQFVKNLDELRRLRAETRQLREQLSESLDMLRTNLRLSLAERHRDISSQEKPASDVSLFDSKKIH
jgi:hypothetical protein